MQPENKTPDSKSPKGKGYGKRPLWQWIAIYVVVGIIVYFLIYLLFFHSGSGTTGGGGGY